MAYQNTVILSYYFKERVGMEKKLSVIVVTWNAATFIEDCLGSLIKEVEGIDNEIIVVDNSSADGTPDIIRRNYPQVTLIENRENKGFGTANNQGIKASKGKLLLLINPDTVTPPGAVKGMVRFIEGRSDAGMVGPEQRNGKGDIQMNWGRWTSRGLIEFITEQIAPKSVLASRLRTPYEVKYLQGGCWLIKRDVFSQSGLYDERLFLYGEEPDMCRRVRTAGWKIFFLRNIEIVHLRGKSIGQISKMKKIRYAVASFLLVFSKLLKV
jgi:GT2 family glycosyltransferase